MPTNFPIYSVKCLKPAQIEIVNPVPLVQREGPGIDKELCALGD